MPPETVDLSGTEQVIAPPASSRPAPPPAVATNPAVVSTPSPQPPPPQAEGWISLKQWTQASGTVSLSRISPATTPTYILHSAHNTVILQAGSRLAHWEGMEVHLGFAPQLAHGQPYVHSLDLKKTLQPALAAGSGPCWSGNPVIVIDPGHGGGQGGAQSVLGNHSEKEYTLDWALRLQALLAANPGWQVYLTRSNDADMAISNRVTFAVEHKAGLFLSLHFNSAAPNQAEAGLETYCLTPVGMPSSLIREFADDPGLICPNNAFDEQNLQFALRVHRALLGVNSRDRGVRRARFPGVLRGQVCPAVLIEGGYLSNPQEAHRIAEPSYRQKLAEAVARAVNGLYESPAVRPVALQRFPQPEMESHAPEIHSSMLSAPVSRARLP